MFLQASKDIELLKKIIPHQRRILAYLKGKAPKFKLRFDYLWLYKAMSEVERNENPNLYNLKILKHRQKMQKIREYLKHQKGYSKLSFTNNDFIGWWFCSEKNFSKGKMNSKGTIYGLVAMPHIPLNNDILFPVFTLIIKAKSTKANHIPAYMLVKIDGNFLGGQYVDSPEFQEYTFNLKENYGSEILVSITFVNDYWNMDEKQDRNLHVHSMCIK